MNRRTLPLLAALLIAAVLFFAVNILAGAAPRSLRLDLTENRLYTLTPGTRNIARSVSEPLHLKLYISQESISRDPALKAYATRVRELLEEYSRVSGGLIRLSLHNPAPFSDEEDAAVSAGLVPAPAASGGSMYFGLVATNSTDDREIVPIFDPRREEFLEYEITRLVYALANPKKPVVGLISSLPIAAPEIDQATGRPTGTRPWQVVQQLRGLFEVRTLGTLESSIPDDVDVLMVVHPKNTSDRTAYAIDQFVLRGGRLLLFLDPNCEADQPRGADTNPMLAIDHERSSDLPRLLGAWGVEMVAERIVGDRKAAVERPVGNRPGETAPYVGWLDLRADNFDAADAVTSALGRMIFATPGSLQRRSDAPAAMSLVPLVQTSTESMLIDQRRVQFFPDIRSLLTDFAPSGVRHTLAARITGPAASAFPDGPPAPPPEQAAAHLPRAEQPVNIIIVADADMLLDGLWVQEMRLGEVSLGFNKFSNNGDFVLSAVDNLRGSSDLISVRARARFARPFTRVQELANRAKDRHLAEQQALELKLRETQRKLEELQRQRPGAPDAAAQVMLTPEQQAEIDAFTREMVHTRKQLREVQHNLRREIDSLGTRIKIVNMAAVPLAVCLAAVGVGAWRAARRRRDRAPEARA